MSINPFLEERLIVDAVVLGSTYVDEYNVEITETSGDQEYRRLVNPFPKRRFKMDFTVDLTKVYTDVLDLYHKCFGSFKGFRVRCLDDFSTKNAVDTPTAFDQPLVRTGVRTYQMRKLYAVLGGERTIYKPVTGTFKVGVSGLDKTAQSSIDTTTGIVTLGTTAFLAITAITKATQAVLTIGTHTLLVNDTVYIANVVGMTQINGLTGIIQTVAATTIALNINSTAFSTYTSGGIVEPTNRITGGCEFDIPVRFDTNVEIDQEYHTLRSLSGVELVELINP